MLTTGAVQSSPAGLTLTGVRGDTASVGTLLSTQGWKGEEREFEVKLENSAFTMAFPFSDFHLEVKIT